MAHKIGWGLASALIAMIVGVVTPAVGVNANGEAVEVNDLSELLEGETRTFGTGEDLITATREGDVIRITLPGREGRNNRVLDCKLDGGSSCYAFTAGNSAAVKMVLIDSDREGDDGDRAIRKKVEVIAIGEDDGHNVFTHRGSNVMVLGGIGEGGGFETLISPSTDVEILGLGSARRTLGCPEGDTTMHLDKDDDDIYYCPKHNVELEVRKDGPVFKRIELRTDDDDEGDLY